MTNEGLVIIQKRSLFTTVFSIWCLVFNDLITEWETQFVIPNTKH